MEEKTTLRRTGQRGSERQWCLRNAASVARSLGLGLDLRMTTGQPIKALLESSHGSAAHVHHHNQAEKDEQAAAANDERRDPERETDGRTNWARSELEARDSVEVDVQADGFDPAHQSEHERRPADAERRDDTQRLRGERRQRHAPRVTERWITFHDAFRGAVDHARWITCDGVPACE